MPLEIRLSPKLTYKLRLSPQMKLSLNLLQLPLVKLKEYLIEQVEKNPLLDDITNIEAGRNKSVLSCSEEDEQKRQYRESLITSSATLQEHLLRQLHLLAKSKEDVKIGEHIIGNINENGYFSDTLEAIAQELKIAIIKAQEALSLIQTFEPIGVGARDLRECLLLQLKAKGKENSLAGQIVDKYLPFLEKKRYEYIAKKLKVTVEKIKGAIKEIAKFEPKPGCSFSQEITQHLIPDAILKKNKDGYEVIPNDWELPRLSLNAKYKELLKKNDTPQEVKQYLQERLEAGRSLIYAVNKRKETIQKIIEEIVYTQKGFLDNGEQHFKTLTISEIANRIGKNKSTVSRAIANKYVHTPYGTVELRNFINSGVKQKDGKLVSSKTIKTKIKILIEKENKESPLTDLLIADRLKQERIFVSRRTIVKYRHQLKILPSKSRRE